MTSTILYYCIYQIANYGMAGQYEYHMDFGVSSSPPSPITFFSIKVIK